MYLKEIYLDNSYVQLDVLEAWLPALPSHSRTEVFRIMTDLMLQGSVGLRHVQRVYDICSQISRKSSDATAHTKWMRQLHGRSEAYILQQMKSMAIASLCNAQLIGHMAVYSETVADLKVANEQLVAGIFEYLNGVATGKVLGKYNRDCSSRWGRENILIIIIICFRLTVDKDSRLVAKVNCSQNVVTKFALFNYEIALRAVPIIGNLVHRVDRVAIIQTAITCLKDLCKK